MEAPPIHSHPPAALTEHWAPALGCLLGMLGFILVYAGLLTPAVPAVEIQAGTRVIAPEPAPVASAASPRRHSAGLLALPEAGISDGHSVPSMEERSGEVSECSGVTRFWLLRAGLSQRAVHSNLDLSSLAWDEQSGYGTLEEIRATQNTPQDPGIRLFGLGLPGPCLDAGDGEGT